MSGVVGWDIGAANVKAAWCSCEVDSEIRVSSHPIEIWREKDRLGEALQSALVSLGCSSPAAMAVTMTAELSDAFETKREGVLFVLETIKNCFPTAPCYVFSLSGEYVPLDEAVEHPLQFAASNWLACGQWMAMLNRDCLAVDVGSTTTDIIPIVDGQVDVSGRTDSDRLSSGELVYTGRLRTNLAAIVSRVPLKGRSCRVSSEYFSISGDIHLVLGNISIGEYQCATPDGRPVSVESARARIARLVCADAEMLSNDEIEEIARYVFDRQVMQICDGIAQVFSRIPGLRNRPVIPVGSGAFLGAAAARRMGLAVGNPPAALSPELVEFTSSIAAARLMIARMKA